MPAGAPITVGLLSKGAPVPLEGVSIDAVVTGDCARVTIAQRYRNREGRPIEAVYVFPLDEGAAVCAFEAVAAGVHYVGAVKPRDEAFRMYDDAMVAGHGAYLLDEERPDVFTASIGNLPPGAEALIRITYVTELAVDGAGLRFTIPTTVSPRYAPHEDTVGVGRPQSEALNPPVAWKVPYGLDLTMALQMPGSISTVASPTHGVSVTLDGARATVTLAQTQVALDRDFVLLVEATGLNATRALVERDGTGAYTAALVLQPSFDVDQAPSEIIFLVDRSGSMDGSSITEVRNALQLCLRSLLPGSRFDIVGFGSTMTSLFGESRAYDEASLREASTHVEAMRADLGGTEILPALQAVLERRRGELPRQVVLLTDGEVTNTDAVIALVRQHASATRVFTFGIGAGASAHLVRGVARAGNGASEFIAPGERLEATVLRQFSRVLAPALSDVRVDWGGLDVTAAPLQPPAVFAGGRIVLYAWFRDARQTMATFSARGPKGAVTIRVPIDPAAATSGSTLATLAARARIREIEEGADGLAGRGSQQRDRRTTAARDEIIRIATTYGLASRETSFVAIEHREVPVTEAVSLRRIPVALTHGWGGLDERPPLTLGGPGHPMHASMLDGWAHAGDTADVGMMRLHAEPRSAPVTSLFRRVPNAAFSRTTAAHAPRPIDRLVALQRADGSWEHTRQLARAIDLPWTLVSSVPRDLAGLAESDRVWATLLALAWLVRYASETQDEWQLLARKAEQWLTTVVGTNDGAVGARRAADAAVEKALRT